MNANTRENLTLAQLIAARIEDLSPRKSQREIAEEVGFPSRNVISIIKSGATKLSLDRVEAMAKALELDLATVMIPALEQYYNQDTISAIRDVFSSAESKAEKELLALARIYLKNPQSLSFETRETLKQIFQQNKPSSN